VLVEPVTKPEPAVIWPTITSVAMGLAKF
jgi:hypothetical protein